MKNIKEATLDEIADLLLKADQDLTSFAFAVRIAVPELLRRLEEYDRGPRNLQAVLDWIETDAGLSDLHAVRDAALAAIDVRSPVPAEPKDSLPEPAGRDRIDGAKPKRTVVLNPGESPMSKLGGRITDTRVIVKGNIGAIRIGGKGLEMDGGPAEILAQGAGSTVAGIKIDGDVSGQLMIGENLGVSPEKNLDGSSMGDFAPIRMLDHAPNLHLVLDDVLLFAPDEWASYDGFGMKWGVFTKGCKLTMLGVASSAAREHLLYGHNMQDVWCEAVSNSSRTIEGSDGVRRHLGNGRTLLQCVNRVPGVYPKGGQPGMGSIVYKNCTARLTGWEGLIDKIGPDGELAFPNYGAGGGAAFTVAGHTGKEVCIEGCTSMNPYAAGIAVYADSSPKNSSPIANPEGYRCWMVGVDGGTFDPTRDLISTKDGWATRRLTIREYSQSRIGSRRAGQVAGVRHFIHDGSVDVFGQQPQLDYQPGIRKIETVEVLG